MDHHEWIGYSIQSSIIATDVYHKVVTPLMRNTFPLLQRAQSQLTTALSEHDKHQHFGVSLALAAAFMLGPWTMAPALATTLGVGLAKETWDHFLGTGFCWWDMAANATGAACGVMAATWLGTTLSG